MGIDELIALGDALLAKDQESFVQRYQSVQPDDYANISYTSGTTADPKGILLTHRNYTANVEQARSVVRCDVDDVILNLAGALLVYFLVRIPAVTRLLERLYLMAPVKADSAAA